MKLEFWAIYMTLSLLDSMQVKRPLQRSFLNYRSSEFEPNYTFLSAVRVLL
jgi:hypothetical protein